MTTNRKYILIGVVMIVVVLLVALVGCRDKQNSQAQDKDTPQGAPASLGHLVGEMARKEIPADGFEPYARYIIEEREGLYALINVGFHNWESCRLTFFIDHYGEKGLTPYEFTVYGLKRLTVGWIQGDWFTYTDPQGRSRSLPAEAKIAALSVEIRTEEGHQAFGERDFAGWGLTYVSEDVKFSGH